MAATGIVQIWWEVWCVAEEGFYVAEYSMLGICRRVEVCRYGPLAGDELDQVLDAVSTAALLRRSRA